MIPQSTLVILSKLLQQLAEWLQSKVMEAKKTEADLIYEEAFGRLGTDPTPEDTVDDEVACAISLTTIVRLALINKGIQFPLESSTIKLFSYLSSSPSWKEVTVPQYADIIISPTQGNNIGHTGIMGKYKGEDMSQNIMSNTSKSGLWQSNYTLIGWNKYFGSKKGLSTHFFRLEHLDKTPSHRSGGA